MAHLRAREALANSTHRWGVAFAWLRFSQIFSGQRQKRVWDGELEHLEQGRAITQSKGFKTVSKRDGRGKAGFSSEARSRGSCCQAFGNRRKKVMSKRGKTSARLNPSQLRPQQNLLLHRIPELNAINPGFQESFSSSRGIGLPPRVRILALTRTRWGWSRSLRQPGAPPASRGGCWAAPGVEQHHLPVSQAAPQQYLSHA